MLDPSPRPAGETGSVPAPLIFFDFETRAGREAPDLRAAGTYRYADSADVLMLAFAIGDRPARVIHKDGAPLSYGDLPVELRAAVEAGAKLVAWNASFDRCVWNYALANSPWLPPEQVRDAMAMAMVSNLPAALDQAAKTCGHAGKLAEGKRLISLFCAADSVADAASHPAEWAQFVDYAGIDILAMRHVWRCIRSLPEEEWAVWAANERVNDRGMAVDLDFVRNAAQMAREDAARTNTRLGVLTEGRIRTVHQNLALADWIYDRLPDAESREMMTIVLAEEQETEDDDQIEFDDKISVRRGIVERLLDYLRRIECPDAVLIEVLELREWGAGASSKKFQAILNQNVRGRLHGQLVFNGAAQTGRFSGKGVQPQNLTRSVLGRDASDDAGFWESPTVDLIAEGCTLDELAAFGAGEVPAKKLGLIVRPAIIAGPGKTLLKSDYAQVEARVLPWLAGASAGAAQRLAYFRRVDADPSTPGLYETSAAAMLHKLVAEITKPERQRGKISELALGFGGGKGALLSMAAQYRMSFSEVEAQEMVEQWRAANPWAPAFWGKHTRDGSFGLFGAAMRAIENPGVAQQCGRIAYMFKPDYLGGTLLCRLPSGRLLTYPWCKVREFQPKDKRTGKLLEPRRGLTFRRAKGLISLYGGRFAENVTQAAAADLLRGALVRLDGRLPVVLHAHDEIVIEVDLADIKPAGALLESAMTTLWPWAKDLPLTVDVTERWFYSSCK